jgi:hypothetical protein
MAAVVEWAVAAAEVVVGTEIASSVVVVVVEKGVEVAAVVDITVSTMIEVILVADGIK